MVEIKFRSLEKWFSKQEMECKGRKCKRKKPVNSENGGRRESEEEEAKKKRSPNSPPPLSLRVMWVDDDEW